MVSFEDLVCLLVVVACLVVWGCLAACFVGVGLCVFFDVVCGVFWGSFFFDVLVVVCGGICGGCGIFVEGLYSWVVV